MTLLSFHAMQNDHQPMPEDIPAGLSVSQAAARLGLSVNAVRHKIRRGTLPAHKVNGEWRVSIVEDRPPMPAGTLRTGEAAESPPDRPQDRPVITPAEIEQAIARTGDKYITDIREMFDRLDTLYQGRLRDKDMVIEELRRRAEDAERERDRIVAEHDQLQAEMTEITAGIANKYADPELPRLHPWWKFWRS